MWWKLPHVRFLTSFPPSTISNSFQIPLTGTIDLRTLRIKKIQPLYPLPHPLLFQTVPELRRWTKDTLANFDNAGVCEYVRMSILGVCTCVNNGVLLWLFLQWTNWLCRKFQHSKEEKVIDGLNVQAKRTGSNFNLFDLAKFATQANFRNRRLIWQK